MDAYQMLFRYRVCPTYLYLGTIPIPIILVHYYWMNTEATPSLLVLARTLLMADGNMSEIPEKDSSCSI